MKISNNLVPRPATGHTEVFLANNDDGKGHECTAAAQDKGGKEAGKPLDANNWEDQECTYIANPKQESIYELEGKFRIDHDDDFFSRSSWQPFGEFCIV